MRLAFNAQAIAYNPVVIDVVDRVGLAGSARIGPSTVVKMIAGTPPDDLGGFFDGEAGVREPRHPSPGAPEVGDALEPPADHPLAQ